MHAPYFGSPANSIPTLVRQLRNIQIILSYPLEAGECSPPAPHKGIQATLRDGRVRTNELMITPGTLALGRGHPRLRWLTQGKTRAATPTTRLVGARGESTR